MKSINDLMAENENLKLLLGLFFGLVLITFGFYMDNILVVKALIKFEPLALGIMTMGALIIMFVILYFYNQRKYGVKK